MVSTEDPPPIPLGVGPPALGVTVFGAVLVKLETDVVAIGFALLIVDADVAVDGGPGVADEVADGDGFVDMVIDGSIFLVEVGIMSLEDFIILDEWEGSIPIEKG